MEKPSKVPNCNPQCSMRATLNHKETYAHSLQEIEIFISKEKSLVVGHTMDVELEKEMEAISKSWSSSTLRMH